MKTARRILSLAMLPLLLAGTALANGDEHRRDVDRDGDRDRGGLSQDKKHNGWEKGKHKGWDKGGKHKGVVRQLTPGTTPGPTTGTAK